MNKVFKPNQLQNPFAFSFGTAAAFPLKKSRTPALRAKLSFALDDSPCSARNPNFPPPFLF